MFDAASIIVNLLLHLALVLFKVGQALLQQSVLLLLRSKCRVISVAYQLQLGHYMRHIVLVNSFKLVPHLLNLATVKL